MCECGVTSVVSDSVTLWTAAPQSPLSWDSPGKNTGVSCHIDDNNTIKEGRVHGAIL